MYTLILHWIPCCAQTLRAALKGRDLQLQEATERTKQLEQALARCAG